MLEPSTITSIYDASFSDTHWHRALDVCGKTISAEAVILYEFSELRQVSYALQATSTSIQSAAETLQRYNRIAAEGRGSNFDNEGLAAAHGANAFEVLYDSDIWKIDANYRNRPEVKMVLEELGWFRRATVNLSDDPSVYRGAIFFFGAEYDRRMPVHTKSFACQIGPHLAKSIELNRLTSGLRRKYNAALSVLDKIETGVFVVLKSGEVILKNRAAADLISADRGFRLKEDNYLTCVTESAQLKLASSINDISLTAEGQNDEVSRILEIPGDRAASTLLAIVSPLRDANIELERGLTGALLTTIDPLQPIKVNTDALAHAYRLTRAEKRLAKFLVKGLTNKEIALNLDVSPETVKTQLSSIYLKCNCKNRLSFVWRIFQFSPPII
ncbi:helix-turn-helix transcriptional regulator [Sulfitobacter sp. W074]|uniref:helix-turn-helix transcriptional regulator n=1 Tax=Sulfitobacter sp. W074 TaxID=2867026 RepID=UPI0021A7647C|nr:LuxR C-terminal-related transcriptional regulator [Sulfitobacter sp. W074]UWR39457.1 LuxR C-terminal-related transcriptional regulator [Sulfitobacter sp. W074]